MGLAVSRELVRPFKVFRNWTYDDAVSLLQEYKEKDYDFGISADSVTKLLQAIRPDLPDSIGSQMVTCFSKTHSGLINSLALISGLAFFACNVEEDRLFEEKSSVMFDAFDFNDCGQLSLDEMTICLLSGLRAIVVMCGDGWDPTDLGMEQLTIEAFAEFGISQDGFINKTQFATWLKSKVGSRTGAKQILKSFALLDLNALSRRNSDASSVSFKSLKSYESDYFPIDEEGIYGEDGPLLISPYISPRSSAVDVIGIQPASADDTEAEEPEIAALKIQCLARQKQARERAEKKRMENSNQHEQEPSVVEVGIEAPELGDNTEAAVVEVAIEAPEQGDNTEAPVVEVGIEAPEQGDNTEAPVVEVVSEAPEQGDNTEAPVVEVGIEAPEQGDNTEAPVVDISIEPPEQGDNMEAPIVSTSIEAPDQVDNQTNASDPAQKSEQAPELEQLQIVYSFDQFGRLSRIIQTYETLIGEQSPGPLEHFQGAPPTYSFNRFGQLKRGSYITVVDNQAPVEKGMGGGKVRQSSIEENMTASRNLLAKFEDVAFPSACETEDDNQGRVKGLGGKKVRQSSVIENMNASRNLLAKFEDVAFPSSPGAELVGTNGFGVNMYPSVFAALSFKLASNLPLSSSSTEPNTEELEAVVKETNAEKNEQADQPQEHIAQALKQEYEHELALIKSSLETKLHEAEDIKSSLETKLHETEEIKFTLEIKLHEAEDFKCALETKLHEAEDQNGLLSRRLSETASRAETLEKECESLQTELLTIQEQLKASKETSTPPPVQVQSDPTLVENDVKLQSQAAPCIENTVSLEEAQPVAEEAALAGTATEPETQIPPVVAENVPSQEEV